MYDLKTIVDRNQRQTARTVAGLFVRAAYGPKPWDLIEDQERHNDGSSLFRRVPILEGDVHPGRYQKPEGQPSPYSDSPKSSKPKC